MRMVIVSPTYHAGSTVVTGLLGAALSTVLKMSVTLLYSGMQRALPDLYGKPVGDPTMSSDILSNLLQNRVITEEDLKLYSLIINDELCILDSGDGYISNEDSDKLITYAFKRATDDVVLCDLNAPLDARVSQEILKCADVVGLVINPDNNGYAKAREYMESGIFKKENTLLIVNRYHEQIEPLRNISKKVGIGYNKTCKLHFNPQLAKACNHNNLVNLAKLIYNKAPEVLPLNNDVKEMCQYVTSITGIKFSWG